MFIFRIAVLYVLSINLLIVSRILPMGGLLGLIAVLIPLLVYARNGKIDIFLPKRSKWFNTIVKFFILQLSIWSLGIFIGLSSSIHQYIIYASMMLCFILVLLATKQNVLDGYIRAYIVLATVMALAGFIAWYLIFAGYVGRYEFLFHGANIGMHNYSWPCYLGLVLTDVDKNVSLIGSAIFYRASGWAEEPAWAASFVMPALIILVLDKNIYRRNLRVIFITIIIIFWIVCAAVSSIISVFLLMAIKQILSSIKKSAWGRLVCIIAVIVLIMAGIFIFQDEIINMSGFIKSKFGENSRTFQSTYNSIFWFLTHQSVLMYLVMSLSLLSAIFIFKVALVGIINGEYSAIYGYVMLYLVFQGAKRGWIWLSEDSFTMFFFYMLVFYTYKQVILNDKVQHLGYNMGNLE